MIDKHDETMKHFKETMKFDYTEGRYIVNLLGNNRTVIKSYQATSRCVKAG